MFLLGAIARGKHEDVLLVQRRFIGAIAASNVLFDSFGGHWIILPLIFVAGFVTHGFTVHVFWTIQRNTYSPGLL
jgi:hypothetical protein